jgi:hypothetical protein
VSDFGHNPMRWDCQRDGCFNKICRPKIEQFAECLPGRIAFSDVDAVTEINDHYLWLEWKRLPAPLPIGQRIMFERLTAAPSQRFIVLVIVGDAEAMEVESVAVVSGGAIGGFQPSTLQHVKTFISDWAAWARIQPRKRAA